MRWAPGADGVERPPPGFQSLLRHGYAIADAFFGCADGGSVGALRCSLGSGVAFEAQSDFQGWAPPS